MERAELASELASDGFVQKCEEAGVILSNATREDATRLQNFTLEFESAEDLVRIAVDFLLSNWLFAYIERRLGVLHPYLNLDEQEYIGLLVYHGLKKADKESDGWAFTDWEQELTEVVASVLERDRYLHLDGIVRFRMKPMLAMIDDTICEMVEHFLADREYEEFVSMLRYMLDAQPPSMQVLHVFCTNDRVWICDASGALVRDGEISSAAVEASDGAPVNPEDLAMSILITRSPCKIVIHDLTVAAPWPSFAETLERVFLDRAGRCTDCSTCKELQRSGQGPNQGPSQDCTPTKSAMPDEYE